MPDWSYHGLFRPLLFRLPAKLARDVTLGAMGILCKLPGGKVIIRAMGHMEMFPILDKTRWGVRFKYPVGLSGGLDVHGTGRAALSQIGFGFIELGPVTVKAIVSERPILRDRQKEALLYPDAYANDGVERHLLRLSERDSAGASSSSLPLMIRIRHMPGSGCEEALLEQVDLIKLLKPYAAGFYIDGIDDCWTVEVSAKHISDVLREARDICGEGKPLFVYIPLDYAVERLRLLMQELRVEDQFEFEGIVLGDSVRTAAGVMVSKDGKVPSLNLIHWLRREYGRQLGIIASGGVHEPLDALELMSDGGADYVQLHSGLVYAGPGLPKRVNEAILHERLRAVEEPAPHPFWRNWGWMCLLGIGMVLGGIIAWMIAASTVLLPYDEVFLGMDRAALSLHNDHLIPFMSHDRITLAGTMISIGVLYFQFARYGLRYNLHWAKTALLGSAAIGFFSFFLYLGYGYFDPLHAGAAIVLLPMFLLSMRGVKDNRPLQMSQPNLVNDRLWLRAQWGQLMFVLLGFALAIGGLVIATVGITHVFVPQDLTFMETHRGVLDQINPRLIAVVAHDRAGFGGALFSDALAILAAALWGIQQGQRWLWWTFLVGGLPGFAAGFSVHIAIGYTDFLHLLPAYFAFGFYVAGLILLYPYMHSAATPARAPAGHVQS